MGVRSPSSKLAVALESQPIPDKTRLAPFGQPDARFALTGRSDQAAWNEGTALNITNGQQFLGTLGLNNFQLASNSPTDLPTPAPAGPPPLDAHFTRDNPTAPNFDWIQPRNGGMDAARDSLTRTADSDLPPDQAAAFRANMKQFERRAQTDHLADREVQSTYEFAHGSCRLFLD
jgi:hypothetical protein